MKIKTFLLTIVVIFSVFNTISCKKQVKDREYNEEEVLTAAEDLIKKSEKLNNIYFGHGIECDMSATSDSNGYYFPADFASLQKFGVETVLDIKTLTRECFTEGLSASMIKNVLSPITDTNGDIIYFSRYYQEYDSLDLTKEKCIMVYSKYEPFLLDDVEYFYDTLRVADVEGEIIIVEIEVKATKNVYDKETGKIVDKYDQIKKIRINLLEEKNGFRIDSPTYVRYNKEQ